MFTNVATLRSWTMRYSFIGNIVTKHSCGNMVKKEKRGMKFLSLFVQRPLMRDSHNGLLTQL